MSELEQTARKIGFLLEGYGQASESPVLMKWARELLESSLSEDESPEQPDSEGWRGSVKDEGMLSERTLASTSMEAAPEQSIAVNVEPRSGYFR